MYVCIYMYIYIYTYIFLEESDTCVVCIRFVFMTGAVINVLHGNSFNLHKQPQIGTITFHTFQMREPRHREKKQFA